MASKKMSNNEILKKISIAQNLRRGDIQQIFELADKLLSYSQVGSFMLKPENRKFIPLSDELFEAFLDKLIIYSRGTQEQPEIPPKSIQNVIIDLAERDNVEGLDNIIQCVNDAKKAVFQAREQESQASESDEEDDDEE
jgi:hypothetical protein